jgi:hypothetical protein
VKHLAMSRLVAPIDASAAKEDALPEVTTASRPGLRPNLRRLLPTQSFRARRHALVDISARLDLVEERLQELQPPVPSTAASCNTQAGWFC